MSSGGSPKAPRRVPLGARASKDMPELLKIAAEGGVDLRSAVTRRFSLEEAAEAYSLLDGGNIAGRAIIEIE